MSDQGPGEQAGSPGSTVSTVSFPAEAAALGGSPLPSTEPPGQDRRGWRPWLVGILVAVMALLVPYAALRDSQDPPPAPEPSDEATPTISIHLGPQLDAPTAWSRDMSDLRPDISDPVLDYSPDGMSGVDRVIDTGVTWVMLTDDFSTGQDDGPKQVVALDPTTGAVQWIHGLGDSGLCAKTLLDGNLVCLSPTTVDASGLGTRWRVEELRPDTGEVVRSADVDGWFCAVHVSGERIVLVEQRLPAPHAVVTALTATLQQAWRVDLQRQANHAKLFDDTDGRVDNYSYGPVLHELTLDDMSPDAVVMRAGSAAAVIDVRTGKQLGLPACQRSHIDGSRLWCTVDDHAVAYTVSSRGLSRTAQTPDGIYLPYSYPAVGPALFCDERNTLVGIDASTGRPNGRVLRTLPGTDVGPCDARLIPAGDVVVATSPIGGSVTTFDPTRLSARWSTDEDYVSSEEVAVSPKLILAKGYSGRLLVIDRTTGASRTWSGTFFDHVAVVGGAPVVLDADGITRLKL